MLVRERVQGLRDPEDGRAPHKSQLGSKQPGMAFWEGMTAPLSWNDVDRA